MEPVAKVPVDELVLTVHAIANFKQRAGMHSVIEATDRIKALYAVSHFCGTQEEPKGRSPGKRLRAPNKPRQVLIFQRFDGPNHWVFFVRGKVLLTVHHHMVQQ